MAANERRPLRPRPPRASRSAFVALLALLFLLPPPTANACRYCVRDTGFVEFDLSPWILSLANLPPDSTQLWERLARSRFLDANIRLESSPSLHPNPTPTPVPATPTIALLGPAQRRLDLAPPATLPTSESAIGDFLEQIAMSPARDRLHQTLLESFAVLLLLEGTHNEANASARRAAEDSLPAFLPLLRKLPKPTDLPPRLLILTVNDQAHERLLLWSLGTPPTPQSEPRLAVLFGRGRCLGPVLEGPLITRSTLLERLRLVGQDCECDLDRASFQGPIFPARWDPHRQSAAARSLGFDPENPLVRTEVARIILRGNSSSDRSRTSSSSSGDPLGLGYREQDIDADTVPDTDPESTSDSAAEAEPKPEPTAASSPNLNLPPPETSLSTLTPTNSLPTANVPSPRSRLGWIALLALVPASLGIGAFLFLRHANTR